MQRYKNVLFACLFSSLILSPAYAKFGRGIKAQPDVIVMPGKLAPEPLPYGETPASIACIYGLTKPVPGCPINGTTLLPNGGAGLTIAVTEGGDDPNAWVELNTFSAQFGLPFMPLCTTGGPQPCFQVAYATTGGVIPPPASSRDTLTEHALDIEWAHAMAPQANIIMVEADTFNMPDIMNAVVLAAQLVADAGGGIVSNSWSVDEFSTEVTFDNDFVMPSVVFIASAGDFGAPARYPASSPNVIAAGGTSIIRNAAGYFTGEASWRNPNIPIGSKFSAGSGGPSKYESRPAFQNSVQKVVGNKRGTPDIAFEADPLTGVDVFVINNETGPAGGWLVTGGTSLAAPALAGVIASANSRAQSSAEELALIYTGAIKNYHSNWRDILQGNNGFPCLAGYDFVTGLGTPIGYKGK